MTHATATVDLMRPPFPAEPGSGVYSNKLGMWVFLASDVMFFTALIGTYIILRFGVSQPWAHPNAVLNVPLTAFNTFLLICSSVSMVKAFAAISQGDQRGLKLWLLITILAGASFVTVQVVEYIKLVGHGFTPAGFRGVDAGRARGQRSGQVRRRDGGLVRLDVLHHDGVPRLPRDLRRDLDDLPVSDEGAAGQILAAGLPRHRDHRVVLALRRSGLDHPV